MTLLRHPRFLPTLVLALTACAALTSCSGAGSLNADRIGTLAEASATTRVESVDIAAETIHRSEAASRHSERRGVRLGLGAGSVW
jgi:hypothetical protein